MDNEFANKFTSYFLWGQSLYVDCLWVNEKPFK